MDIWDWFKGLRRWWWMIVVFPILAMAIAWFAAPEPEYESRWTVNIFFDDPLLTNNPNYIDFVLLDDYHHLIRTGAFGDVLYLRLPEAVQEQLSRNDFGQMVESSRHAHFVEIVVSGDDPELVKIVAETIEANSEEVVNFYLIPPTYTGGSANVNTLDPITTPEVNSTPRLTLVAAVGVATLLVSIAATGVAEWLRISHRAKYSDK